MERAKAILNDEREEINLLRYPLKTLRLSFIKCVKYISCYVTRHLTPSVLKVLIPVLLLMAATSIFLIDSPAGHAFTALDMDKDGLVSPEDFEVFYTSVLGHPSGAGLQAQTAFPAHASHLNKTQFMEWWEEGNGDALRKDAFFRQGAWREVEYMLADAIWWLTLGILSSIGLGTGMHSGLLFLFPHIYLACASADSCGNTNFWTYPVNRFYGPRDRVFVCITPNAAATSPSTLARLLKVVPACVIWGAGTAIGEIPPYALSYAAAQQGKRHADLEEAFKFDVLNRMKEWTLNKIERYGFWAILLLSAWPNMAFDLCGMACGQFLMPFWTFFGATFIGKALIKVTIQALFFVLLFSGDNIQRAVRLVGGTLAKVMFLPTWMGSGGTKGIVDMFLAAVVNARENIAARARGSYRVEEEENESSLLMMFMHWIVVAAVVWFAKSIIESFAQSEQEEKDEETLQRLEKMILERSARGAIHEGELRQLIERARTGNRPMSRSAGESTLMIVFVLVTVAGFMLGFYPLFVLGQALLLHSVICAMCSNESINGWTLYAIRLGLAAAALFALHTQYSA